MNPRLTLARRRSRQALHPGFVRAAAPTNPRFTLARRRARRFDHPVFDAPTYARKDLTPRVQIGILRDPALPIVLSPALTMPKERPSIDWHDVVGIVSAVGFVALFFVGF